MENPMFVGKLKEDFLHENLQDLGNIYIYCVVENCWAAHSLNLGPQTLDFATGGVVAGNTLGS